MMTKLEITTFMAEWIANLETQKDALQVLIDQGKQFITELQEVGVEMLDSLSDAQLFRFVDDVTEYVYEQAPGKPAHEFFESNEVPLRRLAREFLGRYKNKPCAYNEETLVEAFMRRYGNRWGVQEGGTENE